MVTSPGQASSSSRASPSLRAARYCPTGSAWPAARTWLRASSAALTKSGNHGTATLWPLRWLERSPNRAGNRSAAGTASVRSYCQRLLRRDVMTVPVAVRAVIAAVGTLLVLSTWGSMIGTLIVPRPTSDRLTRWVDRIVNTAFRVFTSRMTDHRQRDRVLAAQAAAVLLAQLAAWLGIFFIGYALVLWPFIDTGLGSAFSIASPDVFGANEAVGTAEKILGDLAAFTGLVAV